MRLLILALSFLILISGAVYSTYWFYAAGRVGVEIGSWSRGDGPFGLTIATAETPQIHGFPFNFSITLGQTTIQNPSRWSGAKITVPSLVSWCHPWSPHQWRFEAGDGASFNGQNEATDHLKIQSFKGEVQEFSSERGRMVAADIAATRLEGEINGGAAAAEQLNLHLAAPEAQPQLHTGEALAFAVTLEDMKLPNSITPLGQTISHISAVGAVDGTIPRKPLPEALDAWRDAGGTVEVHHLMIQWGPLSLSGDGTMALDKALQPIGAFSTQIVNYSSIVSALVSSGMIKETDGSYINIGLALLAQKDEEGHSFLKAPLTLQNNHLFIGPAKLTRLPQIIWH